MFNVTSNINANERITRLIIGVILLAGLLLGLTKFFSFLLGVILIVEAIIGWCGIPILSEKLKLDALFNKTDNHNSGPKR
jgi:Protein of unknown function (DUF2892)